MLEELRQLKNVQNNPEQFKSFMYILKTMVMLVVQFKNKKRGHRVHNSNFGLSWWVAEKKPLIKKNMY